MTEPSVVLEIEGPHFSIKLYEDLLVIDVKGSFKNKIEETLENEPVFKETIGRLFGIFVPLHIRINDIDSVHLDEMGKVTVQLRYHRNIVIPFERKEDAEILVKKLDELISTALTAEIKEQIAAKRAKRKQKGQSRGVSPSSYSTVPYYFPTEQVDVVPKLKRKRKTRRN